MRIAAICWVVLMLLGCLGCPPPRAEPTPPPATAPAVARPAAPTAPAPDVMATVNGQPIYLASLVEPLVEAHGLRIAEMLIGNVLVAQEARRKKLTVTAEEVSRENERSLSEMFGKDITADQRQRVLQRLLGDRGLTQDLWDATMRRNALLRKMAEPRVTVPEASIRAEYAARYGEKVQIAHIQLPGHKDAEKIIARLKAGADFGKLAREHSTNTTTAKDDGALPPFARDNASVPRPIRETAFEMKVGEISNPVLVGDSYHVLTLYKRIPPGKDTYEAVKEALRADLRGRLIRRVQVEILSELRRNARVDFIAPALRRAAARAARRPAPPGSGP